MDVVELCPWCNCTHPIGPERCLGGVARFLPTRYRSSR